MRWQRGPAALAAVTRAGVAPSVVTPEIAAEAAVWVARLHGPARSRNMERECLAWQARSGAHREAFERCTQTWQDVPRVTLANAYAAAASGNAVPVADSARRTSLARWAIALGLAALVAGGGIGYQQWRDLGSYGTRVGEQQQVLLDDGTRMSLNTDTRVRVRLTAAQRMVDVLAGEALFEVAKDPGRPFVVRAGGSEVVALGTVFAVRFAGGGATDAGALAVTLIEGRVTLRPAPAGGSGGVAPAGPVSMEPGERVRLVRTAPDTNPTAALKVDRPNLDQVVAWKRSEVVFDDVSLADAVAEMNRYSRTPIELVGDATLVERRVSGLYRAGDNAGFARAVAALHGLVVHERPGRLELAVPQ